MYTGTVGAHVTSCLTVLFIECAHGFVPSATINSYGPRNIEVDALSRSRLYLYPSMNFSCDGIITDIRMRMFYHSQLGASRDVRQEVLVHFLIFHNGLNSPTSRVTHIFLNNANTKQEFPNEIWTNSVPLSLPVTKASFIGLAVPENRSLTMFTKPISSTPLSLRSRVKVYQSYQLTAPFSEFEGTVLELARTADSSQFTQQSLYSPLIDVSFSE